MNLFNLSIITYSAEIINNKLITKKEIRQALFRILLKKTSDIINNFFKLIKDLLIKALIYLI